MTTLGTVRVRDSHMTSEEVAAELAALTPDHFGHGRAISDRAAVTIASWYQTSGTIGSVLASFSSGIRVDANDLHDDVEATMRHHARTLGAMVPPGDLAELAALLRWVGPKRSGVQIVTDTYRVVDDGHGGSTDVDHDIATEFIAARAESGEGWHESRARVLADAIRREYLTFDDADWATAEPYTHPTEDRVTETTAHLQNLDDTTENRVRRMVNAGR